MKTNKIVVLNDDVNSFQNVIKSLVEVCNHDNFQAEQCALVIHHKGKCDVKSGEMIDILPMYIGLLERGLKVEIETI